MLPLHPDLFDIGFLKFFTVPSRLMPDTLGLMEATVAVAGAIEVKFKEQWNAAA